MPMTSPAARGYHSKPPKDPPPPPKKGKQMHWDTASVNTLCRTSQEQLGFSKPLREAVLHPGNSKLGPELPASSMGNPKEPELQGTPVRELGMLSHLAHSSRPSDPSFSTPRGKSSLCSGRPQCHHKVKAEGLPVA